MAWNAEISSPPPYVVHPRRLFVREVFGIAEAVFATLLFLALYSAQRSDQWIGSAGDWTARNLVFVFGRYVAFILPAMLGLNALNAILGRRPLIGQYRTPVRMMGAVAILVSSCAIITLYFIRRGEREATRIFEAGGLIGSFLVDAEGMNLQRYIGRPGAFVILYGCLVIGAILFSETMLRDAGFFVLRTLGVLLIPARWLNPMSQRAYEIRQSIGRFWFRATGWLLHGINFRGRSTDRVMAPLPILDIRPMGGNGSRNLDPPAGYVNDREFETATATDGFGSKNGDSDAEEDLVESPFRVFRMRRQRQVPAERDQPEFAFPDRCYELPAIDILAASPPATYRMTEDEAEELSQKIEQTLAQFKIEVEVIEVIQGPTVTRFAMRIAPGIRVNKILALENDLALALKAQHVRILAPIPGQAAVGIEVPNKVTNGVYLRELLENDAFKRSKAPLSFALGKNISGEPVIADLAQMPHVLIAGTTGSGKSVCLNTIIASMLFRNSPDRVKFVMIDPKRVELSVYQAIPHLIAPVVCDPRKAAAALAWTVEQMESRYKLLAEVGVRNIDGYNAIVNDTEPNKKAMGRELKFMPHIVMVIDELADLMMVAKNEVEEYVIRLAQMARAVGIHLIVATQRPSVNVITGIIKANFPSRIAFRVSSKVDSRTILDMNGAEALMGRGDMLYSPGGVKPFRIQGAFVSDGEIERLADRIRSQEKARYQIEDFTPAPTASQRAKEQLLSSLGHSADSYDENGSDADGVEDGREFRLEPPTAGRVTAAPLPPADMESLTDDDLYDVALKLVLESRKASVSYIQRRLKIGYARAGRVMDMMEQRGIVGPYQGSKPRDLLVNPNEYAVHESGR